MRNLQFNENYNVEKLKASLKLMDLRQNEIRLQGKILFWMSKVRNVIYVILSLTFKL